MEDVWLRGLSLLVVVGVNLHLDKPAMLTGVSEPIVLVSMTSILEGACGYQPFSRKHHGAKMRSRAYVGHVLDALERHGE